MKSFFATTTAMAMTVSAVAPAFAECTNDVWNHVMETGVLTVGVKADYMPWGFRETDGSIVGMEIDMAQLAADAMGVELETIAVVASNRMQFLEQGQIDMMIATMTDRLDRREIVGIVGPNYYSSGTNILAPDALDFTDWSQLEGQPVCGVQGAFYNQIVEERYGAEVVAFAGTAEARQALRDRRCVAFVYDDSSIMATLATGEWEGFGMPLATEDDAPWGLAVPLAEAECVFGNFMSGLQYNWHRDGTLVALEAEWGIQATPYLARMNEDLADHLAE